MGPPLSSQGSRDLAKAAWPGQTCTFCGAAGGDDFMVVCGASGCSRWMHPSCAAENQATEARMPSSATAALGLTAFCTQHTIIRDMRNGAYTPPLDAHIAALSSIAERAADTDLLESVDAGAASSLADQRCAIALRPDDRHLLARVASFWRRRRERRRADSGSLCARVKADEVPLIDIVGRFEIVRRSDDGIFGMSSVLSMVPELQLMLSRLLEAGRWVPVMFTAESIARFGLDAAHSVEPTVAVLSFGQDDDDDDDGGPSAGRAGSVAEGDEHGKLQKKLRGKKKPQPPPVLGQWPELPHGGGSAAALHGAEQVVPALRRLADSLSLLCGASENMKLRESAKSDAVDATFEQFAAEGLLPRGRGRKAHRSESGP